MTDYEDHDSERRGWYDGATQAVPEDWVDKQLLALQLREKRAQRDLSIQDLCLDDYLAREQDVSKARVVLRPPSLVSPLSMMDSSGAELSEPPAHVRPKSSTSQSIGATVFSVYESPTEIRFSIGLGDFTRTRTGKCDLYYGVSSDNVILLNDSDASLAVSPVERGESPISQVPVLVHEGKQSTISPGPWMLSVYQSDGSLRDVVEFLVRPPQHSILLHPAQATTGKRVSEDTPLLPSRKGAKVRGNRRVTLQTPSTSCSVPSHGCAGSAVEQQNLIKATPFESPGVAVDGNTALSGLQNGKAITMRTHFELYGLEHSPLCKSSYSLRPGHTLKAGTCANVFTALQVDEGANTTRAVVVKTFKVPPKEGGTIEAARRWWQEYFIHQQLRHDRICALVGADARIFTLIFEHHVSLDLASSFWRFSGKRYTQTRDFFRGTPDDARRILADIASALNYLGKKSIKHNDIKPPNILYRRGLGAVLADFGVASPTTATPKGGTPFYLPPEALFGERGHPADIWALGVTFLYLLGCIPLPEASGGYGTWDVEHIDPAGRGHEWREANQKMRGWLRQIRVKRNELLFHESTLDGELGTLVAGMLCETPPSASHDSLSGDVRITAEELEAATSSWDLGSIPLA